MMTRPAVSSLKNLMRARAKSNVIGRPRFRTPAALGLQADLLDAGPRHQRIRRAGVHQQEQTAPTVHRVGRVAEDHGDVGPTHTVGEY